MPRNPVTGAVTLPQASPAVARASERRAIASESDPWLRPAAAPAPADNQPNAARVELGKMLFFDPRLSRKSAMSCASCHNPSLGWSDGLPTASGFDMQMLGRATPTILNTAFNTIQMWDGRKANLEDQALGPIAAEGEMNMPLHGTGRRASRRSRVTRRRSSGPIRARVSPK